MWILDLKKTTLCKICVSRTVEGPLLTRKSPQNCGSGIRSSENQVSGGPPVYFFVCECKDELSV